MRSPLDAALANPWDALRVVLDGPLHPGGVEQTETLLDRADVTDGTVVLDVGCGAGDAVSLARQRGARAVGLDIEPAGPHTVRGDLEHLPVATARVEVVLAECVLCLASHRARAVEEIRRSLQPGGRLALSDVVVEGDLPPLPAPIVEALCLEGATSRDTLVTHLEHTGFDVRDVRDHRDDLLAMRDRLAARVDYESLLGRFGDRGQDVLDGIRTLEAAVERGEVGYVSLVGTRESDR